MCFSDKMTFVFPLNKVLEYFNLFSHWNQKPPYTCQGSIFHRVQSGHQYQKRETCIAIKYQPSLLTSACLMQSTASLCSSTCECWDTSEDRCPCLLLLTRLLCPTWLVNPCKNTHSINLLCFHHALQIILTHESGDHHTLF